MSARLLFVHSDLDDAGLDAESFRVLAHVARRADGSGVAYPSMKTAAKVCRLNKDTIARRLRDLVAAGWLTRVKRPGLATGFSLTNGPEVIRREGMTPIRPQGISDAKGYPSKQVPPIRREGSGVIRPQGSEGNPIKDIPEGNPNRRGKRVVGFDASAMELPFPGEAFRTAWIEWVQHLREKKKPLGESAAKKQLGKLAAIGEARAITAIDHSIASNWQGIFETQPAAPSKPQASGSKFAAMLTPKEEW